MNIPSVPAMTTWERSGLMQQQVTWPVASNPECFPLHPEQRQGGDAFRRRIELTFANKCLSGRFYILKDKCKFADDKVKEKQTIAQVCGSVHRREVRTWLRVQAGGPNY